MKLKFSWLYVFVASYSLGSGYSWYSEIAFLMVIIIKETLWFEIVGIFLKMMFFFWGNGLEKFVFGR